LLILKAGEAAKLNPCGLLRLDASFAPAFRMPCWPWLIHLSASLRGFQLTPQKKEEWFGAGMVDILAEWELSYFELSHPKPGGSGLHGLGNVLSFADSCTMLYADKW